MNWAAAKIEPWSIILGVLLFFIGLQNTFMPDRFIITPINDEIFNAVGKTPIAWTHLLVGAGIIYSVITCKLRSWMFGLGAMVCSFWVWAYISPAIGGGVGNIMTSTLWAFVMARMISESKRKKPILELPRAAPVSAIMREYSSIYRGICIRCDKPVEYIVWPDTERPVGLCEEHLNTLRTDFKHI